MTSTNRPANPDLRVPRATREVLERLRSWGEKHSQILGILLYGSVPRGTADHFSDVDLIVVQSADSNPGELVESIVSEFDVLFRLSKDGKSVLYLRRPAIKIELTMIEPARLPEFKDYFESSPFPNLSAALLVLKNPSLYRSLEEWWKAPQSVSPSDEVVREANSFLYYYEGFHPAFHRGDHFRAYFLYSLAFYKLGSFLAAVNGRRESLYSPERLVDFLDTVDSSLRERFEACAPVWGHDLTPLLLKKELMFNLFETALQASEANLPLLEEEARTMRQFVRERYPPLWRWRDLGGKGRVAPRLLFRAARLDRYPADVLSTFLKGEGIRTVVDLRTDAELQRHNYPPGALDGVRYVRIPVWPSLPIPNNLSEQERLQFFYRHATEDPDFLPG